MNRRKVNECRIGLATIELLNGNYEEALLLYRKCKHEHCNWNKEDTEGLLLIEKNIEICEERLCMLRNP